MKKVIDGKVYDTDTAQIIAEWSNAYGRSDFHFCEEQLLKTASGRYFIAGEGGAMSRYQEPAGNNSWTGGSDIEPLTEQEALQWCEDRQIDADIIALHFQVEEA